MHLNVSNMFDTINFYGKPLLVREFRGQHYVAMKQLVETLGLAWRPQYRKIKQHFESSRCLPFKDRFGQRHWLFALPADDINQWIFGIDVTRVKRRSVVEAVLDFRENLDVQAKFDSIDMIREYRGIKFGDNYRKLPMTETELNFLAKLRKPGQTIGSISLFLGYRWIEGSVKCELDCMLRRSANAAVATVNRRSL